MERQNKRGAASRTIEQGFYETTLEIDLDFKFHQNLKVFKKTFQRFENILSGQLSREEAVLAKQKDIDQKKAEADELKKVSDKLLRRKELLDQREAEALRRRNQVRFISTTSMISIILRKLRKLIGMLTSRKKPSRPRIVSW